MSEHGKKGGGEEEGGGHSVGLWYVSFSDMITLLLSFFVMLSTFSTYDKGSLEKMHTAWAYIANYSIFPGDQSKGSMVPPGRGGAEYTREGSEKRPAADPTHAGMPAPMSHSISNDVYSDRRVFYIPSSRLFFGNGCALMPAGKAHLKVLASFLKLMPCQVAIMESAPGGENEAVVQRGLERSWVLADYFIKEASISPGRFRVKSTTSEISQRMGGAAVIEIDLLAREL